MISILAQGIIWTSALVLITALVPVRRLIAQLPPGTVRNRWYAMVALIALFLAGYLGYSAASWSRHSTLVDLIVPGVFLFGAGYVLLTAILSLQTAMDVIRVSRLEREVVTDPLTGVFNRRYLDRRLDEEVARARRYTLPLSVLMLDIDHFKQVNDVHGHPAGDQILIDLARLLASELRGSDILARYGGEEFLIINPQTPGPGATGVGERLCRRIEQHGFKPQDSSGEARAIRISASIGVGSFGDGVDSADKLVQAADTNLYRAKRDGRNRVVAGAPDLPPSSGAAPAHPTHPAFARPAESGDGA